MTTNTTKPRLMSGVRPRRLCGNSIIDDRQFQGNQSWQRTTIYSTSKGARLRLRLRYNAYAFQSLGIVEHWSEGKWQEVASIPYSQLAGVRDQVSYVQQDPPVSQFNEDETELLSLAVAVLN